MLLVEGLLFIAGRYQRHVLHQMFESASIQLTATTLNMQEHTVPTWSDVQWEAGLQRSDGLTPQQLGLAVDELRFPRWAVALAGVVEDLDEGALLSSWTGAPLVKRIFKHQVKLWAVLEEERLWGANESQYGGAWMPPESPPHRSDWRTGDRRRVRRVLTLLGSMPLTCRSWSSVHCDLLTKAEDPWNCFTFVRDTWAGFLFVTMETIKAQLQLVME